MHNSPVAAADESTFAKLVLEQSSQIPVLVDFWAEWCGPCRMLGPVLERIGESQQGRVAVVKVNTDESPNLAARYRIQGIPAVKLFVGGEVVAEFTGAQPEPAVLQFLDQHLPSGAEQAVREAQSALDAGDRTEARSQLELALKEDPNHGLALFVSARMDLQDGELDAARTRAEAIPAFSDHYDRARGLLKVVDMAAQCQQCGGSDAARQRAAEEPDDPAARLALGRCLAAEAHYEEALEELLASVAADRRFEEGAAAKEMVALFHLLGPESETVRTMRRQLTIYS